VSFLFPLYLLGAAALAIPVILHLRRRPPRERIPFSSLMFLEKSPERLTRRTRLERWLLLALRCLALLLLALAFGRPFLESLANPVARNELTRAVVLVDRSASMQREDVWARALDAAREAVGTFEREAEIALAFFDESATFAADLSEWADLGPGARRDRFDEIVENSFAEPTWLGTDLGAAMTSAADRLLAEDADRPATRRQLVVVSDFQDGAARESLRREAWPGEVAVHGIPVHAETPGNFSLDLASTPARANIDEPEIYRVRVTNAADSDTAGVTVSWQGFPDTAMEVTVAPGSGRIVSSEPRPAGAERATLAISGDAHPFDDEVHVSPVQARPLRVFFLDESGPEEGAGSPLFYLRRALQPTPTLEPVIETGSDLAAADLTATDVVVASDAWSPETGERLHAFASDGGLVLALPGPEATSEAFAALSGRPGWTLDEASVDDYSLLGNLDFEHPVLEPFARARIRDFTRIRFWKHRRLRFPEPTGEGSPREGSPRDGSPRDGSPRDGSPPEDVRVIARFDRSAAADASSEATSPALIECEIGDGSVFAFLSGWEPSESQLALSSKFVPLLYSILERGGHTIRSAPTLYVGETDYDEPGFYEVERDGVASVVAVNLAPSEGRTAPFDPAVVFAEWGIPLLDAPGAGPDPSLSEAELARLESREKEERQKLWKWLLLAALVILVIESWLASRRSRGGRSGVTVADGGAAGAVTSSGPNT